MKHGRLLLTSLAIVCFLLLTLTPVHPVKAIPPKVGLVTDSGGVADMTFNYMANQGLQRADTEGLVDGTLYESASSSDYATLLQQCVTDGNELCFAVGFSMSSAVETIAVANPGTKFAILDVSYDSPPANLRGILFNEKQVGYLAGVLAAKMSSSDVGVVAGMNIPPVARFVDGYRNGAQCSAPVDVLVNYTGTFTDPVLGAAVAADMISRGADVIFGAGGQTGNGAILYSAQNGGLSIGIDADQYLTVFGNGTVSGSNKLLSSAMKRLDNAVYQTIQDKLAGTFSSATVTYGLDKDGVGLAPFHETDGVIPQAVKDHLAVVKAGIIAGTIDINYPCQPRFHAEIVENDVFGVDWLPNLNVTLQIDDPSNGAGWDFTDTRMTNLQGFVMFDNLGGLSLATGMVVNMTDGSITKTHTIIHLVATEVDPETDTVSGTGEAGANLNVQHCDGTGCSWRRFTTVQPDNTWSVDFSVPGSGSSPEEQNILDIQPGTQGEALYADNDGDHTDYLWLVPGNFSKINPANGAKNQPLSLNLSWEMSSGAGFFEYCIDTQNVNPCGSWTDVGTATQVSLNNLLPNTTYYWQVRTTNYNTKTYANGSDSAIWSFKTSALPMTVRSTGTQDGYILESGENTNLGGTMDSTSTTLRLGDDAAKKQYRDILSFATASLPDNAIITKVTLKVKRQGVIGGGDPVTTFQGFMLDIKKGIFGTTALQVSDWQTAGNKTIGPFKPALVGGWYEFNLTSIRAYINKLATGSGLTQIRLRFKLDDNNNLVANYLSLFSGDAPIASRPTLVIEYYVP